MNRNKLAQENLKAKIQENKESEEQIAYNRKITKERNSVMIQNIQREIDFKKEQLEKEIIETISIHRIPDGTAIRVDGYLDGKKPKFIIENEIDSLNQRIEEFKDQNKNIEELENANTNT